MSKNPDYKSDPDFANLVRLLAVFSEASARQAALSAQLNLELLDAVDEHREEYAINQAALANSQAAITTLCDRNPEWFAKKKTLSTPYGTVKSTAGSKLVAANPEASIRLIEADKRAVAFIRQKQELDLEALEALPDAELAKYGIARVPTETVSIKPAALDLGKAVKAADEAEKEAA